MPSSRPSDLSASATTGASFLAHAWMALLVAVSYTVSALVIAGPMREAASGVQYTLADAILEYAWPFALVAVVLLALSPLTSKISRSISGGNNIDSHQRLSVTRQSWLISLVSFGVCLIPATLASAFGLLIVPFLLIIGTPSSFCVVLVFLHRAIARSARRIRP